MFNVCEIMGIPKPDNSSSQSVTLARPISLFSMALSILTFLCNSDGLKSKYSFDNWVFVSMQHAK